MTICSCSISLYVVYCAHWIYIKWVDSIMINTTAFKFHNTSKLYQCTVCTCTRFIRLMFQSFLVRFVHLFTQWLSKWFVSSTLCSHMNIKNDRKLVKITCCRTPSKWRMNSTSGNHSLKQLFIFKLLCG